MITERIDPPALHPIPGAAHVTVAEGGRLVFVSGQAGRHGDGSLAGETVGEQAVQALRNLRTALEAAGARLADVARLTIYIVDYTSASLDALIEAAIGEYGEAYPITACTLVGVAALWEPGLLIEIDALAVV
jgi:enamine deaminase RidA (YjgF/YER057c/UK114 family)